MEDLERPQEVDDVLLVLDGQPAQALDDPIGLAPGALVVLDSLHQITCAPVVEEEDALPYTPEGGGSELVGARATLRNAICQASSQMMDEEVGKEVGGLVGEGSAGEGRRAACNHLARG